jgi:DMSO/TMAO reductase YedYZ molybdopterin-dependent catalytic subunit
MSTRRDFLLGAGAIAASTALRGAAWAQQVVAGKERLIVNSYRFLDLEMPVEAITSFITPVESFFVRNHMAEPFAIDVDTWQLRITGEVERPQSLSYRDLARLEPATTTNTLECAGNGRAFYSPHVPGVQWRRGAVGTARFTGPRLADVLQRAGVKRTAHHVAFIGLDEPPSKVPQFIRSIPIEKATHPDTLVALQMNGARLLKHHGYPARALVPGWIGAASAKWLAEIRVLPSEFDGNFMKPGYRLPLHKLEPGGDLDVAESVPATALNVKSLVTSPRSDVHAGAPHAIAGAAWAGENDVAKVDVSVDGGRTWQAAHLGAEHAKYAWRLWRVAWTPRRGAHEIVCRATDSTGRTQPETSPWNPSGYLWNGWDRVKVNAA